MISVQVKAGRSRQEPMHAFHSGHYDIRVVLNGRPSELWAREMTRKETEGLMTLIDLRPGQIFRWYLCDYSRPH